MIALSNAALTSTLRLISTLPLRLNEIRRHRGLGPIVSLPLTRVNLTETSTSAERGFCPQQTMRHHLHFVPLGSRLPVPPAPPALDMNNTFAHKSRGADQRDGGEITFVFKHLAHGHLTTVTVRCAAVEIVDPLDGLLAVIRIYVNPKSGYDVHEHIIIQKRSVEAYLYASLVKLKLIQRTWKREDCRWATWHVIWRKRVRPRPRCEKDCTTATALLDKDKLDR